MDDILKQLASFRKRALDAVNDVYEDSFIDVLDDATERVPVDTGFLQDSIIVGTDTGISAGKNSYARTIKSSGRFSPKKAGWEAEYAPAVEFGAKGRAPVAFAQTAALSYQRYVAENVSKVK